MNTNELPMGFSMALALNPEAMKKFSGLSEEKQSQIISGTHNVNSKTEMRQYVTSILSME